MGKAAKEKGAILDDMAKIVDNGHLFKSGTTNIAIREVNNVEAR